MGTPTFSLGIDLGTSNSAIASAAFDDDDAQAAIVEVTQILGANAIGEASGLPSALYIPHPDEFPADSFKLPWDDASDIVGTFARDHGALVPDRLVTSAKSWLSNPHVDPRSAVLPWKSQIEEGKISPVQATTRYLQHLKQAFLHTDARDLANGRVILTVPASFDEAARNLTLEAANAAGFDEVVLLEEPQAAFYSWTAQAGSDWRSQVQTGDVILVCDVGGGTADFSLIAISDLEGNLEVERISVGEHILLGGDNMDLALAYTLRAKLEAEGKSIDDWQFLSLIHAARQAKVALFSDEKLKAAPIAVPSRGSSLLKGTVATKLDRETLEQVVLDGFFPVTAVSDLPIEGRSAGLQEFGLPYASDPVLSKHLARFLTRSLINVKASDALRAVIGDQDSLEKDDYLRPTAVLFNGGVFKAEPIRNRVLDLLKSWNGGDAVKELQGFEPDLAVARGAAAYGRIRETGQGIRIKAGAARSYYIGLESSMPAVPGFTPPVKALCIVPQGMEEGSERVIENQEFGLVTGHPADFRFFSSEVRSGDECGSVVADAEKQLDESTCLSVTLPVAEGQAPGEVVPVKIHAIVTELGNLELWMQHETSGQRWNLEFQVRTA
ncbi:MAG: molecular chaperone DnaK (HSP70) [Verrucomicrobiales bacterium]|jgi:molecular chaperone DnaK (HSP70)